MAFVTAGRVSRVAVSLLTRSLVLPMTVTRAPGSEFAGDNGDTITVRVRQPRSANTQATPGATITYGDIVEVPVEVTLTHLYDATRIPDESLSLEVVSFAEQITEPQAKAIAVGAEDQIANVMNTAIAAGADIGLASDDGDGLEKAILEARRTLGRADVPAGDRWLAVNPEAAELLLTKDKFTRVDASGNSSALRDAIIGRLYGFTIVETSALDASGGAGSGAAAVAYHSSAFVWANRSPVNPRGANDSASATEGGVSLRQVFDFDPDILSDRSVLSTFAGANSTEDARFVTIADESV